MVVDVIAGSGMCPIEESVTWVILGRVLPQWNVCACN